MLLYVACTAQALCAGSQKNFALIHSDLELWLYWLILLEISSLMLKFRKVYKPKYHWSSLPKCMIGCQN